MACSYNNLTFHPHSCSRTFGLVRRFCERVEYYYLLRVQYWYLVPGTGTTNITNAERRSSFPLFDEQKDCRHLVSIEAAICYWTRWKSTVRPLPNQFEQNMMQNSHSTLSCAGSVQQLQLASYSVLGSGIVTTVAVSYYRTSFGFGYGPMRITLSLSFFLSGMASSILPRLKRNISSSTLPLRFEPHQASTQQERQRSKNLNCNYCTLFH